LLLLSPSPTVGQGQRTFCRLVFEANRIPTYPDEETVFSVQMALHVKQNREIEIDWPFLWICSATPWTESWPMKNYGFSLPDFDTRVANGTCLFTPLPTADRLQLTSAAFSNQSKDQVWPVRPRRLRHQTSGGDRTALSCGQSARLRMSFVVVPVGKPARLCTDLCFWVAVLGCGALKNVPCLFKNKLQ
jgi:hypothetical protein